MQFWVHRSLWLNSANPAGTRQGSEQMYLENGNKYYANSSTNAWHRLAMFRVLLTATKTCGAGWDCWSKTSVQKKKCRKFKLLLFDITGDVCHLVFVKDHLVQPFLVKARPRQDGPAPCPGESDILSVLMNPLLPWRHNSNGWLI